MKEFKKNKINSTFLNTNKLLKKIFFLFVFICLIPKVEAQGIKFIHDLDLAINQAKLENKLVFVDFYTSWCGPCKVLDKNVFPLEKVGSFFNDQFISCKIQCDDKGNGVILGKKYSVNAYPTLMFLNGNGEMVHSQAGAPTGDKLIEFAKTALNPEKRLLAIIKKWDSGNRDKQFVIKYFTRLKEAYRSEKATKDFIEFFHNLNDNDKIDISTYELVKIVGTAPFSKTFNYIETHKNEFYKTVGQKEIDEFIAKTYLWHLHSIASNGTKEEYAKAMKRFKTKQYSYYEEYKMFYNVFQSKDMNSKYDIDEYMKRGTKFLSKYGKNNDTYSLTLTSLLGNLTGRLNQGAAGILWMENLLKRNPNPKYMSTYFYILWRNHQFDKAIKVGNQIRLTAVENNVSTELIDKQILQVIAMQEKYGQKT